MSARGPAATRVIDRSAHRRGVRMAIAVGAAMAASIVFLEGAACFVSSFVGVLAILALGLWADLPRYLRVAPDGLELRLLGRRQFVPWDEVLGVLVAERMLTIERAHRRTLELYRPPETWPFESAPTAPLGSLGWDVENALARHRRAKEAPPELEPVLGRRARTHAAWLAHLRELAAGDAYRRRAPDREALLSVVEQATDATARVAATLTLRRLGLRPEERERVAVVRVRVADPALAVALDAAMADDDRAAERAACRVRAHRAAG